MPTSKAVGRTTRDYLREATADSHERLDLLMGELVVDDEAAYAVPSNPMACPGRRRELAS